MSVLYLLCKVIVHRINLGGQLLRSGLNGVQ